MAIGQRGHRYVGAFHVNLPGNTCGKAADRSPDVRALSVYVFA